MSFRRAKHTDWFDHVLAIYATFGSRNPSDYDSYNNLDALQEFFTVVFPTLQHVLQQRSQILETEVSRVTPLSELENSPRAELRFDPTGTKTYQVLTDLHLAQ